MSTEQKQDIHCGTCTVKGDMVACLATPCSVRSSWFANSQAAEIERLTGCLEKANIQAEKFEREWYLRGDEIEALKAATLRQEVKIKVLTDALEQIKHSITQMQMPGNDKRREVLLIQNTVAEALTLSKETA